MIKDNKIIKFDDAERWCSNMVTTEPFVYGGITYTSTENAYQASKAKDFDERVFISKLTSYESKTYHKKLIRHMGLVNYKKNYMILDFDDKKLQIMYDVNVLKFSQPKYKRLLLSTGDMEIIEGNTWDDQFWGVELIPTTDRNKVFNGYELGNGHNNLGKVLMRIRTELLSGIL